MPKTDLNFEDKNVSQIEHVDPLSQILGKVVIGVLANGRTFSAKLTGLTRDELVFETRSGLRIVDRRDQIVKLVELQEGFD